MLTTSNRTVFPFLGNKTPVPLPVADSTSIVPIISTTKNVHTKNDFFNNHILNAMQVLVSDDSVTSENNSECALPTIPTVPTTSNIPTEDTNTGTILHYDVNKDVPS